MGSTDDSGAGFGLPFSGRPPVFENRTRDAFMVVPGIMGSVLKDTGTGRTLWGADLSMLTNRRLGSGFLGALHTDEQERAADADTFGAAPLTRIRATELISRPWWLPVLEGLEPYSGLTDTLGEVTLAPEAVRAFPYDWRLAVAYNGAVLARAARAHLTRWRERVAATDAWLAAGAREPQLVFVAHSMGGLVVRAALEHDPGLAVETRSVISVGTPFLGSAGAVLTLNLQQAGARPAWLHRHVQRLAATLPSVHDLLPAYRCLDLGREVDRLTPRDVARFGGDEHLAARSLAAHVRHWEHPVDLPGHRAIVGVAQPTVQTLREERLGGVATAVGRHHAFDVDDEDELVRDVLTGIPARRDTFGDGTVHTLSAHTGTGAITYVPGRHGALPCHAEVLDQVKHIALERRSGGRLSGDGPQPGLETPRLGGTLGAPLTLAVTGVEIPDRDTLTVRSATTGRPGHPLVLRRGTGRSDSVLTAHFTADVPDLYRVTLKTPTHPLITQLVLVSPSDASDR
ncbi:esterase/lipase family protein [Streptomyces globisporus]